MYGAKILQMHDDIFLNLLKIWDCQMYTLKIPQGPPPAIDFLFSYFYENGIYSLCVCVQLLQFLNAKIVKTLIK